MSNRQEAKESFCWETKQKRIPNSRLLYHTKLYRVKGAGAYVSIRKPIPSPRPWHERKDHRAWAWEIQAAGTSVRLQ